MYVGGVLKGFFNERKFFERYVYYFDYIWGKYLKSVLSLYKELYLNNVLFLL